MSHYKVTSGPSKGWARRHIALLLAALLAAVLGLPAFTTMTVSIDGHQHRIERGSTAADVVTMELPLAAAGDIVDMTGSVVASQQGAPPMIERHGSVLAADDRIHHGDVLTSQRGLDVVEHQIPTATPIPVAVEYRGDGPLEHVASTGSEGVSLLGVGSISGLVTPLGVSQAAEPMVVERTYPVAGDKVVALTFDDGPWPGQTERILKILENEGVPATFFVLGSKAKAYPSLTASILEQGHQVESHGYSHRSLGSPDKALAQREARKSRYEIAVATGEYPTWFRAPGGHLSEEARTEVVAAGMRVVRWDVDPQDWRKPPAWKLARETLAEVRPGSVILLHDGGGDRTSTINALTTIIRKLQAQGYIFVTLDEMGSASRS